MRLWSPSIGDRVWGRTLVLSIALSGCSSIDGTGAPPNADPQLGCSIDCHGTETSNAPPKSITGVMETSVVGNGAHREHLRVASDWHRQVECADCHLVPASVGSPGHLDGDNRAEVVFGPVAGSASTWNGSSCTTGCHGSSAFGGTAAQPVWTQVDGSQSTCGSCHGAPPPPPHPTDPNCATCHPTMEEGGLVFRDPASHINGVVDVSAGVAGACSSCHGSTGSSAPPKDLAGNTSPTIQGVGTHAAHLAPSNWHNAVTCASCHRVPVAVDSPGHLDGDNLAEVVFDTLNPAGTYNRANATCANQYCHGNGRGNNGTRSWITPGALACGACHSMTGTNMSGDHLRHIGEENMECSECHADVVNAANTIIKAELHVNGVHEVKMVRGTYNPATRTCTNTSCHGPETW